MKKKNSNLVAYFKKNPKSFIVFLICFLIAILFVSTRFSEKKPVVESISPAIGYPGETLIIRGKHFKSSTLSKNGEKIFRPIASEVSIAGVRPISSSYLKWSENEIKIKIPPDVGSGELYIKTTAGKSNGFIFTNRAHIPLLIKNNEDKGLPIISEFHPSKASIGELVIIRGDNFGIKKGDSRIYFTSLLATKNAARLKEKNELVNMFSASEIDFDYEFWSDKEIHIRVPDGSMSGNIKIYNDRGLSNSKYIEIVNPVGEKVFVEKRGYQVSYGVEISDIKAGEGQHSLYLWLAALFKGGEQTNIEYVSEPEPDFSDYYGIMMYHFDNPALISKVDISQTYWFHRFELKTKINPEKISSKYNLNNKFYEKYTSSNLFIPSDNNAIKKLAYRQAGNVKNPYYKTKRIYNYILDNFKYDSDSDSSDILKDLKKRKGDSYTYSMLFCSMLRSLGVPARPVSGYFVYNNKETVKHFWAEFFIDEFGWIPVDCTLGDGVKFGENIEVKNPRKYYFGNIDNKHITFTKGVIDIPTMDAYGRLVKKKKMFSLQTNYEEITGSLKSYNSNWQNLYIIDWW